MFQNGLTKENILVEGKDLSYPDSVVEYFKGMMGQPEGGFPEELQKIVLKGVAPITERPGALLPSEDFGSIKKLLTEKYDFASTTEEALHQKAISFALYPKVYEDYCETS
jgi:pyruvate carboxylase